MCVDGVRCWGVPVEDGAEGEGDAASVREMVRTVGPKPLLTVCMAMP